MQVISTDEAEMNLARVLASVEAGEEFVIARDNQAVAKIIPYCGNPNSLRPKVGQLISAPFHVPDSALAPLTEAELGSWGL
jgi:antitoxin (DNA-binding transcriptional repressor) of toxin-antitoxin stability system